MRARVQFPVKEIHKEYEFHSLHCVYHDTLLTFSYILNLKKYLGAMRRPRYNGVRVIMESQCTIFEGHMEDWHFFLLLCQISSLVKYRWNKQTNIIIESGTHLLSRTHQPQYGSPSLRQSLQPCLDSQLLSCIWAICKYISLYLCILVDMDCMFKYKQRSGYIFHWSKKKIKY